MNNTKHTQGPWRVEERPFMSKWRVSGRAYHFLFPVALCYSENDAHLVAAAPELLEALDAIFNGTGMTGENMDLARAAIKKAKGE